MSPTPIPNKFMGSPIRPGDLLVDKAEWLLLRRDFASKFHSSPEPLSAFIPRIREERGIDSYAAIAYYYRANPEYGSHWEAVKTLSQEMPTRFTLRSGKDHYDLKIDGSGKIWVANTQFPDQWDHIEQKFLDPYLKIEERRYALEIADSLENITENLKRSLIRSMCIELDGSNRDLAGSIVGRVERDAHQVEELRTVANALARINLKTWGEKPDISKNARRKELAQFVAEALRGFGVREILEGVGVRIQHPMFFEACEQAVRIQTEMIVDRIHPPRWYE